MAADKVEQAVPAGTRDEPDGGSDKAGRVMSLAVSTFDGGFFYRVALC